jgi:hypothetical protein
MAIIQYSSLVNKIIGKVGGTVFQKMGQSYGIRMHRNYVPSQTNKSNANRFMLRQLGSTWNTFTLPTKQNWSTQALTYPIYNRYGVPINLTGYQLFIYIGKVALTGGIWGSNIAQPYSMTSIIRGPISCSYSLSTGCFITYTTGVVTNYYEIISASKLQNSQNALAHPKFYFVKTSNTLGITSEDLHTALVSMWGKIPVAGQYFSMSIKTFVTTLNQWRLENTVLVQVVA